MTKKQPRLEGPDQKSTAARLIAILGAVQKLDRDQLHEIAALIEWPASHGKDPFRPVRVAIAKWIKSDPANAEAVQAIMDVSWGIDLAHDKPDESTPFGRCKLSAHTREALSQAVKLTPENTK